MVGNQQDTTELRERDVTEITSLCVNCTLLLTSLGAIRKASKPADAFPTNYLICRTLDTMLRVVIRCPHSSSRGSGKKDQG